MDKFRRWLNKFYQKQKHPFRKDYAFDAAPYSVRNMDNFDKHPTALICEGVLIRNGSGKVEIGENSQVGPYTIIFAGRLGVFIGKNVMIAPHVVIAAGNHDYRDLERPMRFSTAFSSGPIIIGNDVWIGANSTITDGITIGDGAVIGANSAVTHDVASFDIVAGVPARIIRNRKEID
jgi:acetyltransferase-like isoleucine patch superfamily enzyme